MDGLTTAEQQQLEQRLAKRQIKDFMTVYANLVDNCFTSCVEDFTSKALSGREAGCLNRCVLKTLVSQQRLSERFAENNLVAGQMAQQQQQR